MRSIITLMNVIIAVISVMTFIAFIVLIWLVGTDIAKKRRKGDDNNARL